MTLCYSKAQCTAANWTELNWTKLNWIVQFSSSLEFSSVFRCALNQRRAATTGNGRRRFSTVKNWRRPSINLRRPSPVITARRRFSSNISLIGRFTSVSRLWRTCDDRRFRRRIIAGRRRFNAQQETELNWTVQSSFPLCIGLYKLTFTSHDANEK